MCQNQILKSQGHQSKANRKPSVCQISPVGRQPDGVCRWWRRAFTIRLSAQTSRLCKLHSLAAWLEHQQSGDRAIRRSKMKIETIRPRSSQLPVHGGFLAHPGSTGHTRSHCPMSHGCRILHCTISEVIVGLTTKDSKSPTPLGATRTSRTTGRMGFLEQSSV